jgi:putative inorganic carbon (HCO3(-)) transporter
MVNEEIGLTKNNDLLFILISIVMAALAAVVLGNPDTELGLYGIAGILGVVMVMAIILKPNFGANILIFVVFTNMSRQFTDHGLPGIVSPLVIVVFGAIMIRNYYAGQLPTDRKKTVAIETFIILYFVAMVLSYLAAADKDRALSAIEDFAKNIIIIYTVLFSLREWGTWKQAIRVVVLTTAFLCSLGVYQLITGNYSQNMFGLAVASTEGVFDDDEGGTTRLAGPVRDPNMWSEIIVAVIPLVLFRIINDTGLKDKLFGSAILSMLLIVLLNTYSRGAYLALMVVGALTFIVYVRRINPLVAFGAFGAVILMIPLLPSSYIARFDSLSFLTPSSEGESGIYEDGSLQGRSSVMLSALAMFADHPLIGVGAGNFQNNYPKYSQIVGIEFEYGERDPHSLYTQIMAETGLLGLIFFIGAMVSLLGGLSKSIKSIDRFPSFKSYVPWLISLQVSIVGYLVAAIFLHNAYIRYFWVLVALAITAIQLIDEQLSTNSGLKMRELSH